MAGAEAGYWGAAAGPSVFGQTRSVSQGGYQSGSGQNGSAHNAAPRYRDDHGVGRHSSFDPDQPADPLSQPARDTYPLTQPQASGRFGQHQEGPALPAARPAKPAAMSLPDAVKAAHSEGYLFGESVGRGAPGLWLEAVLARKPRMPSDLEARLLQGSSLPIDSLLHDEVRHSQRHGFWDALETLRR